MNKTVKHIVLASSILLATPQAMGSMLTGGDFANNCSIADWDQFGDAGVSGAPGNCAATLSVDDVIDFETELSQGLSLSSGIDYTLNVDFSVDTTMIDPILDDWFSISLLNQDFEFIELFYTDILSAQSFSESLTIAASDLASYANQDWSLSFYMFDGFEADSNQSTAFITFASLDSVVTDVPAPAGFVLLLLGFAGLFTRKALARSNGRPSQKAAVSWTNLNGGINQ